MPSKMHKQDSDCTPYLDADDQCTVCGVSHANECPSCGGRGFHKPSCPDSDANWKVKLPATDQSTNNPSHDVVLPGERNPNHTRLWIVSAAFSNWPTFLGAVWADNEQDALDTLIDAGLGKALWIDDLDLEAMDEKEQDSLAYLGNEAQACDLDNVGLIPVKFSATRDKELLGLFKRAREDGLSNLGEL